jgi:hypothetical protein
MEKRIRRKDFVRRSEICFIVFLMLTIIFPVVMSLHLYVNWGAISFNSYAVKILLIEVLLIFAAFFFYRMYEKDKQLLNTKSEFMKIRRYNVNLPYSGDEVVDQDSSL